ncbi:hypothetical protein ACFY36_08615 [Actinoplanes sp. NPDC000266]
MEQTLFRTRPALAPIVMFGAFALALTVALVTLGLIFDFWPTPDADFPFVAGLPLLMVLAGSLHTARRWQQNPEWVRVSDAGIELANGTAPVFIAWANVATAEVHRPALTAVLDVIPIDPSQVTSPAPHGTVPALHQLPAGPGFRVQVGHLLPGPAALRRALSQHAPERTQPGATSA